jgi:putative hemolysin
MMTLMSMAGMDPFLGLKSVVQHQRARLEHAVGPLVVFIVAAAIVLALAVTLAAAAAIFCMYKGGNLEWVTTNGWNFWELKIACRLHD